MGRMSLVFSLQIENFNFVHQKQLILLIQKVYTNDQQMVPYRAHFLVLFYMDNQDGHHNWTKISIGDECENLDQIYFSEIFTSMCFGLSSSKPTSFCVDFESSFFHVHHEFKNRI